MKIFSQNKKLAVPRVRPGRIIRGFTLIELMIVVSIIAIVVTVSLAGYSGSEKKTNLDSGIRILEANLNVARNNFLNGLRYAGAPSAGGWGIHFDVATSTYTLFADTNNNGVYDAGEAVINSGGQNFDIGQGLKFSRIDLGNTLDIDFYGTSTPRASMISAGVPSSTACVEVAESSTNRVAGIRINDFGFFEVVPSCD